LELQNNKRAEPKGTAQYDKLAYSLNWLLEMHSCRALSFQL